jgi:hypothetical protein
MRGCVILNIHISIGSRQNIMNIMYIIWKDV